MNSAFAWLSDLISLIGSFFPRLLVVHWDEIAILWVLGKKPITKEPGWYLYFPFKTTGMKVNMQRRTMVLSTGPMTTSDNQIVLCGATVIYKVKDAWVHLVENENVDDQMDEVALAALCRYVEAHRYKEIASNTEEMSQSLTELVQNSLSLFGVEVIEVSINSFAQTFVVTISGWD